MEPGVHWQLDMLAKANGRSINSLIIETLDKHLIGKEEQEQGAAT